MSEQNEDKEKTEAWWKTAEGKSWEDASQATPISELRALQAKVAGEYPNDPIYANAGQFSSRNPRPGLYRHFRNGLLYRLIGLGLSSGSMTDLFCVYVPLYESQEFMEGATFVLRPVREWSEKVDYTQGSPGQLHWHNELEKMGSEREMEEITSGPRFIRVGD